MNPERSSEPPTASLIQENADINRIEAHQKHKEQKDKECFVNDYKIGDHAMLKRTTGKKRLSVNWVEGPYVIEKKVSPVNYAIMLSEVPKEESGFTIIT